MAAKKDNLPAAVEELERALDGGAGGAARLDQALARLEEAVRRHAGVLYQPDGLIGAVDRPRLPSPGVDRDIGHLREELEQFLRDIQELRARAPVAGQPATRADHAALLGRARELAAQLEQYGDREARLILESVNTDIGAGD